MKSGSRLERVLEQGLFGVTAQLHPPQGNDWEDLKRSVAALKGGVDAVGLTDNYGATVRMSGLAASSVILETGVEPILHMTTRDRNRIALQSDLLGAAALGVKNLVCSSGAHQSFGNQPDSENVYDLDSIQWIDCVRSLRDQGTLLGGTEKVRGSFGIWIGAVVNPFMDPLEPHLIRLGKKIRAGADFIQTQPIFDMARFKAWMERISDLGLPERVHILASVSPLKFGHVPQSVPIPPIPESLIRRITQAEDPEEEGIRICVEQIQQLREMKGIHGIQIMEVEYEPPVKSIVEKAGLLPRPQLE
jgi:methylenetetrahydrofolate reductase (NADPH)